MSMEISAPATPSDDMTPLPERPKQSKFRDEEQAFLRTHLPAYEDLCQHLKGKKGVGPVRGRKRAWVISEVYPRFVKECLSDQNDGPQLESLQDKIVRWFRNHTRTPGSGSKVLATVTSGATSKRPRATNGASVYAEEHKSSITERMAELRAQEGGDPKLVNLKRFHTIKRELYHQLTDDERRAYETKAAKKNEARKAPPKTSEIFGNQGNIVGGVVGTLHNLIGWDWGQYGEAIFFVQGAYRNAEHNLKTFNVSVSPNPKITSFSLILPDYKNIFRAPFREWAEKALPVRSSPLDMADDIAANHKYVIYLQEDGSPHLPVFDIDLIAPTDARSMLKAYIELSWEFAIKSAVVHGSDLDPVPWDLLDTVQLRRKLLVKPEVFSHLKTLDPMRMSLPDLYNVLTLLVKGQDSGVRVLEFSVGNSNTDSEPEISELMDPSTQSPEPPASPRDMGIENANTARQSSPPSMVEVTVAEAGYLHIIPASQEGKNADAGNSHSRKRNRGETEQDDPSEDKRTRKRISKKAVPPREQSSRLKDVNYTNKHVTVRLR